MRRSSCLLLGSALILVGCSGPSPQERDNRRLVDAVLTAITVKNARLVEDSAKRAKARRDAGHLSDEQYRGLEAVLTKARAGDWGGAEKEGYAFRNRHPFVREGQ